MNQYERDYTAGSKTRSRQLRRDVRQALGTSSDQLPDVLDVLAAARALGALLDNASGGRFGISVFDFTARLPLDVEVASRTPQDHPERFAREAFIPVGTAVEIVTELRRAERERREREDAERVAREAGRAQAWADRDAERAAFARRVEQARI